jgi:oligopeptide/dipeptide ABC transporter ATP-binding protein
MTNLPALLSVRELSVRYRRGGSPIEAVDRLDLDIASGETLGILGESGCGKSTLALAIMGLLPRTATATGSIVFDGEELVGRDERELQRIRGAGMSLIFQEPGAALNPVLRVGVQIAEVVRAHEPGTARSHRQAAERTLAEVALEPARFYDAFPHQLSGGQRQRVAIAQALVCRPRLVIADEPTAALDAAVQLEILELMRELKQRTGVAFLLISHNPAVLAFLSDRLMTMYAGRSVEAGSRRQVLGKAQHPYTQALLACMPAIVARPGTRASLPVIEGQALDPASYPRTSCRFEQRCPVRMEVCREHDPATIAVEPGHHVSCFHFGGTDVH